MRNIYCTLLNHKYLSRGLALFESLQRLDEGITLYVVAMDDIVYSKLLSEKIEHLTAISITDIENENPEMLAAKDNRSPIEYCWTCTPCAIAYILTHFECDVCTYLDADIYFYQNPDSLLNELGDYSTILIPHRYSQRECGAEELCGKYCVEFVPFRKREQSMEILEHWREQCLEWCYDRFEDGKFGDQKYLEEWEKRDDVYVSRNHGMGAAPWNVERYDLVRNGNNGYDLIDLEDNFQRYPLVFYHYSHLKLFDKDVVCLDNCHRTIPDKIREELYVPYLKTLQMVNEKYHLQEDGVDYNATEHFRSDDLDHLIREFCYFRKSSLLSGKEQDL